MATFYGECSNITGDSADFYADFYNSASSGYTGTRYIRLTVESEDGNVIYDEKQITGSNYGDGAGTTFSFTITGLDGETTYYWSVYLGYKGTGDPSISWLTGVNDSGSFTTKKLIIISAWDWNKSNGNATAAQTQRAYNILNGDVSVGEGFSYKVWNDFVDKVAEACDYDWRTNNNTYLSYNNCKVSTGDTLSAAIYNSVKLQIGSRVSGGTWADVSSGDRLYGWHIINLAEKLNDLIEQL